MSLGEIRIAEREGARLVIGFQGTTGSGKTYTALQFAWGLANGDASKVGLLDTENRRGSLYADALVNSEGEIQHFHVLDFMPPFSPDRYIQGIRQFEEKGVEVLVIDSVSHEWDGLGGCIDIARNTNKKIDDWLKSKNEHHRFMQAMLQSSMHIIVCIRTAEKTSFKNPKKPEYLGFQPIQEKKFGFELTGCLELWDEGRTQNVVKVPKDLLPILGKGSGYIGPKHGLAVRRWVDGGRKVTPEEEKARHRLQSMAEQGVGAVQSAWEALGGEVQLRLGAGFLASVISSAEAYEAMPKPDDGLSDLNSQIMGDSETDDEFF